MNNAGVVCVAELEMIPSNIFRRVIDVNLLGMVNVTKACLPLIRQARGRVVNMSSVLGEIS